MSAYHRHYATAAEAATAGEIGGAAEGAASGRCTTRFVPCDDCGGMWAVAVNEYGHPWTGWPECPAQPESPGVSPTT